MSGPGKDVTSLQTVILDARKAGDLAKMLIKAREAVSQQEDTCSRELSRLGRFDGDLEDLTRRSMPEWVIIDTFEKKFDELDDQIRESVRRLAEASEELGEHEEKLKSLLRSCVVPSLEDLQSTRRHREQGWKLIRCMYVEEAELGADAAEYSGSKNLPDAYEQAVMAADEVGDRLRIDAQRVQERVNLETQIQTRKDLISGLDNKHTLFATMLAHLKNEWEAAWQEVLLS